ncbi:MAG: hypothetical protein J7502_12095, partial [Flavisolibacter sp.]|nr:hypothetical protein [Flavisolibacter sp.]
MKQFGKCLLMCALVILGVTRTYAQQAYTEVKPSANAQQFISALSSSNNLHTGQVSVNIPLFNLQGKGINVPISMSFNSA